MSGDVVETIGAGVDLMTFSVTAAVRPSLMGPRHIVSGTALAAACLFREFRVAGANRGISRRALAPVCAGIRVPTGASALRLMRRGAFQLILAGLLVSAVAYGSEKSPVPSRL